MLLKYISQGEGMAKTRCKGFLPHGTDAVPSPMTLARLTQLPRISGKTRLSDTGSRGRGVLLLDVRFTD